MSRRAQLLFVATAALLVAATLSHLVAIWIKLPPPKPTYRRIGPQTGPQVFCAGSSLLQFGLSWREVSDELGQGIESWGIAGSTPVEWEVFQNYTPNSNLMLLGVSVYDLNEYHLCDTRANIVSISQTMEDLRRTGADWEFAKRSLGQYPLAWLRKLFPTAGKSRDVIVRVGTKLPKRLRPADTANENGSSLIMPGAVMDFGAPKKKVSDWSKAKTLRRLASLREENRGLHGFNGPKSAAIKRMLLRAEKQGRVIVIVLPVSPSYLREFVTPEVARNFETALIREQQIDPDAGFVRLDKVTALNSDEFFNDLVHLNAAGREIATNAFSSWLTQNSAKPNVVSGRH